MKIGIAGYGNLGRATEIIARDYEDVKVIGVFTRRKYIKTYGAPQYAYEELFTRKWDIDVLILCYGSSSDLPMYTPRLTELYNTVDTFDNHKRIAEHKKNVNEAALRSSHVSLISVGWDPGFLSLMRLYFSAFLPHGTVNTFWGRGVSQGHSEALRRIPGVINAVQYTAPKAEALTLASLICHPLDDTDRHKRVCYVACEKGREDDVKKRILSMENYFSGYETEIHFTEANDPIFETRSMSHRGRIYGMGKSGVYTENKHSMYLDLETGSNPELTAHIALLAGRVCYRLSQGGVYGAHTLFDISPSVICEVKGENANKYL